MNWQRGIAANLAAALEQFQDIYEGVTQLNRLTHVKKNSARETEFCRKNSVSLSVEI